MNKTLELDELEAPQQEEILLESSTKHIDVTLAFTNYIGLPYWPERAFLIDLGKSVHPKLGEEKKAQARQAALEKIGKTVADYDRALIRAARPFYTINDKNPDLGDGEVGDSKQTLELLESLTSE